MTTVNEVNTMDFDKLAKGGVGLVLGVAGATVVGAFTVPVAPQVTQPIITLVGALLGAFWGYESK